MRVHVAKQGECLSSIAHAYGFQSYKDVYDCSENADFRKKRPDPAVIMAGDEIAIPDPTALTVTIGQKNQIVLTRPVVQLRVNLTDLDGSALADQTYVLRFDGGERKGQTTSDGLLEETVPASIAEASVEFPDLDFTLRLRCGTVDPVDTITGLQTRLNNLGFGAGPVDGVLGPLTRDAIRRFQEANQLTGSGEPDGPTHRALAQAYGC